MVRPCILCSVLPSLFVVSRSAAPSRAIAGITSLASSGGGGAPREQAAELLGRRRSCDVALDGSGHTVGHRLQILRAVGELRAGGGEPAAPPSQRSDAAAVRRSGNAGEATARGRGGETILVHLH